MSTKPLFDPVSFLNEPVSKNATRKDPRPPGEPLGQVLSLDFKDGIIGKGDRKGQPWYRLDAKIEVTRQTDSAYLDTIPNKPEKETFTYGMMYDGDEAGRPKVGPNVNVNIGRFREACRANGKPYASCIGALVRLQVAHKIHPTETNSDGSPIVLDEVKGVAAGM